MSLESVVVNEHEAKWLRYITGYLAHKNERDLTALWCKLNAKLWPSSIEPYSNIDEGARWIMRTAERVVGLRKLLAYWRIYIGTRDPCVLRDGQCTAAQHATSIHLTFRG